MWQVSWPKKVLIAFGSCLASACPVAAQDYVIQQNQNGFDLPGVTLPQGQDEVRAADGTTCSSSVAGSGAYLDVGLIRGNRSGNDLATYGRVVVPLGKKPKRLDCSKLYELEVQRLKMELELLKMGVGGGGITTLPADAVDQTATSATTAAPSLGVDVKGPRNTTSRKKKSSNDWARDGWTDGN